MNRRRFLAAAASAVGIGATAGPSGGDGAGAHHRPEPDLDLPYRRPDGAIVFDPDVVEEIERRVGEVDLLEAHDEALREGFSWSPGRGPGPAQRDG